MAYGVENLLNLLSKIPSKNGLKMNFQLKGKDVIEGLPKFIDENIEHLPEDGMKILRSHLEELKEPTLDIAMKAKSNYQIAALNLKDGNKSVANIAISRSPISRKEPVSIATLDLDTGRYTDYGESAITSTVKGNVLKFRSSVNNGKTLQANGYYDTTKGIDIEDISLSNSLKKGKAEVDLETGKFGVHTKADLAEIEEGIIGKLPKELQEDYMNQKTETFRNLYENKLDLPDLDEGINEIFEK